MNILFLSRWFPYPPDNGSKIRVFNVLKQLSERHRVSLVTFASPADRVTSGNVRALRALCQSVRVVPYRAYQPSSARAVAGLLAPRPRFLVDTYSQEMQQTANAEFRRGPFDLAIVSQLDMTPYALAFKDVPLVLEELEVSVIRDSLHRPGPAARRLRHLLTWLKLSAYLRRILPRFALCTVVSESERRNLQRVAPDYPKVEVVPNAIDLSRYTGDFGRPRAPDLIFTGALTYFANLDAARFFLEAIHPLIASAAPELVVRLTGDTTGVDLKSLPERPGVLHTGYVPDVRPLVAQSWASVVPLRIGGGTRLKILESMALGTPVVSTTKGAEGLDVTPGEDLLIADEPGEFATRVVELLRSPALGARLARRGRALVASKYDWDTIGQRLCALVERAA